MRAGVPPREDAGRMFRQIVRGLRYLHTEKRLVHRDIKLENVLVDEAGVCRIADFGMARTIDGTPEEEELPEREGVPIPAANGVHRAMSVAVPRSNTPRRDRPASAAATTTTEFQPGSLPYAAPELLRAPLSSSHSVSGKTKADAFSGKSNSAFIHNPKASASVATTIAPSKNPSPAQDIWALGVLLYALLTGVLPFMDNFEPRLVLKILSGEYAPPTNVSARTLVVLRGCLAQRVQDRWNVERVDEAAWSVGGEDVSAAQSDDSAEAEEDAHARTRPTHAHKHPAPAPPPLEFDRGRSGAAARRASERAERSSSRAPYSAVPPPPLRSASSSGSVSRSRTRARTRSPPPMSARSGSVSAYSHSQSRSGSTGRSGSGSRSRSPGPRTPVDVLSPLMGLGLGMGMGLPSGMGKGGASVNGNGFAGEQGRVAGDDAHADGELDAEGEAGPGSARVAGSVGGGVLGGSMLLSPVVENENVSASAGRRGVSIPPVAWRGAGSGSGRSRSLSGTGAV